MDVKDVAGLLLAAAALGGLVLTRRGQEFDRRKAYMEGAHDFTGDLLKSLELERNENGTLRARLADQEARIVALEAEVRSLRAQLEAREWRGP
jgi:hypothetical protein